MLKKEKTWNVLGLIVGIVIMIMGIVFISTPADSYIARYADSVSFGGDYYTYQYEVTEIAANNVAKVVGILNYMAAKNALYSGCLFIAAGILVSLHYAKKIVMDTTCVVEATAETPVEPIGVTESEEVNAEVAEAEMVEEKESELKEISE